MPARLQRRPQPFVLERRRQPDVDDGEVGPLEHHRVDQRVAVLDRGDDVDAVVAQEPGQPVAEQREILGDHDPHGITALT